MIQGMMQVKNALDSLLRASEGQCHVSLTFPQSQTAFGFVQSWISIPRRARASGYAQSLSDKHAACTRAEELSVHNAPHMRYECMPEMPNIMAVVRANSKLNG
jgi:hypothetical protein